LTGTPSGLSINVHRVGRLAHTWLVPYANPAKVCRHRTNGLDPGARFLSNHVCYRSALTSWYRKRSLPRNVLTSLPTLTAADGAQTPFQRS
jgi:hypothetical protein